MAAPVTIGPAMTPTPRLSSYQPALAPGLCSGPASATSVYESVITTVAPNPTSGIAGISTHSDRVMHGRNNPSAYTTSAARVTRSGPKRSPSQPASGAATTATSAT